jgi:SAM-dependent methyltransferase
MDVRSYNRDAWDKAVERLDRWTQAVSPELIAKARTGDLSVVLTPTRAVPKDWLPESFAGVRILGLASAGGQQCPLFAAAGAKVTVFDNSPRQLDQDRMVAARDNLELTCIEGDMADLSACEDASFDLVFNPCSTCFVPDVDSVWKECFRVLRPGGTLLTGFINPVMFTFDKELENRGVLQVKHALPYSDLTSLSDAERARYTVYQAPLEFSHTLSTQIGSQLEAGFQLIGLYEDTWGTGEGIDRFFPAFIATRAKKPEG